MMECVGSNTQGKNFKENLGRIADWAEIWQLGFTVDKCKVTGLAQEISTENCHEEGIGKGRLRGSN